MLNLKNQISIQSDLNGEMGIGRFEWRNGDCHKLKADLNMEIYRAYKDKAYIHKRKNIQSMYPQIFFNTQKRTNKACTDLKIF